MHVGDLDALEDAARGAERERGAWIVRVDVNLQGRLVPDHHQRVSERLERGLEIGAVEPLSLDDEHGAVAVPRPLLVDRVDSDLLQLRRHLGKCLASDRGRHPAEKL